MLFPTVAYFFIIFTFWPNAMDYSQGFLPKLVSFFVVLLLLSGRCYDDAYILYHSAPLEMRYILVPGDIGAAPSLPADPG